MLCWAGVCPPRILYPNQVMPIHTYSNQFISVSACWTNSLRFIGLSIPCNQEVSIQSSNVQYTSKQSSKVISGNCPEPVVQASFVVKSAVHIHKSPFMSSHIIQYSQKCESPVAPSFVTGLHLSSRSDDTTWHEACVTPMVQSVQLSWSLGLHDILAHSNMEVHTEQDFHNEVSTWARGVCCSASMAWTWSGVDAGSSLFVSWQASNRAAATWQISWRTAIGSLCLAGASGLAWSSSAIDLRWLDRQCHNWLHPCRQNSYVEYHIGRRTSSSAHHKESVCHGHTHEVHVPCRQFPTCSPWHRWGRRWFLPFLSEDEARFAWFDDGLPRFMVMWQCLHGDWCFINLAWCSLTLLLFGARLFYHVTNPVVLALQTGFHSCRSGPGIGCLIPTRHQLFPVRPQRKPWLGTMAMSRRGIIYNSTGTPSAFSRSFFSRWHMDWCSHDLLCWHKEEKRCIHTFTMVCFKTVQQQACSTLGNHSLQV